MKFNIEFELTDCKDQPDPNLPISIIEDKLIKHVSDIFNIGEFNDLFIDVANEDYNYYTIKVLRK